MRTNKVAVHSPRPKTHEGGLADRINIEQQLRRTLMNCLLWEKNFYEDGIDVADRLYNLTIELAKQDTQLVNDIVCEAREQHGLRHAPLLCAVALAECCSLNADTVYRICDRPDQMTELLSLYSSRNKGKITPLSNAIKRGIARSFTRFNAYSLAKYNRSNDAIKLRDVMFLSHPKGVDEAQQLAFNQLAAGTLPTPDTWEVALSAATDKRAEWTRLIEQNKLGALAYIRNLRNMSQAGVSVSMIRHGLKQVNTHRIFPYQLLIAGMNTTGFNRELEGLLRDCVDAHDMRLLGRTAIVLDRSGSMNWGSDRDTKAIALGMVAAEMCEDHDVFYFANTIENAGSLRGFEIQDQYSRANVGGGTSMRTAIQGVSNQGYDRVIVITDEQSSDPVGKAPAPHSYMMNVACYKNGVGYRNGWQHIDGFSSNVLNYILAYESQD